MAEVPNDLSFLVKTGCKQGVHKVDVWVRETANGWASVVGRCSLCEATFQVGAAQRLAKSQPLFGPPVGPKESA